MSSVFFGGKTKAGHKNVAQKVSNQSNTNKFSPIDLEEAYELPKGSGYRKRDRKLTAKAAEFEDQNKKKNYQISESQTICPFSPISHK